MRWRTRSDAGASRFAPIWPKGFARQGVQPADFRRYLIMALGSADEMRLWCRYCLDLGYLDEATWQTWRQEYREIAKMLQGLIRTVRARA